MLPEADVVLPEAVGIGTETDGMDPRKAFIAIGIRLTTLEEQGGTSLSEIGTVKPGEEMGGAPSRGFTE